VKSVPCLPVGLRGLTCSKYCEFICAEKLFDGVVLKLVKTCKVVTNQVTE